jgi:secreted Zn-dependent insulinase-like peptidase
MLIENNLDNLIKGVMRHGPDILESCVANPADLEKYLIRIDQERLDYPVIKTEVDRNNWFIPDNVWLIPKLNIIIMLESLYFNATPLNVAFTEILCDCIKENMIEYAYYADCAGLHHDVKLEVRGMELVFYGYQHKIPVLLNKAVEELKKLCTDSPCKEALFKRLKENLVLFKI